VPALARQAEHVTMVQRSPGYLAALPSRDRVADTIRHWLPARTAYSVVRWKNVLFSLFSFQLSRRRPETMKAWLRKGVVAQLPAGYDVDTHFTPRYNPWDQRLCLVPDADLFRAIRAGRVSVLTDRIETFTEQGLRMASGAEIAADIVVTATGLNLAAIGGMRLTVDGVEVDLAQTVAYKGMMLSGVPNFAMALGYTNASWTLKCDLVSTYVCRLLVHLDRHGYANCVPVRPELSPPDPTRPDATELTPLLDLSSGYIQRSVALLPRQGPRAPWRLYQNYPLDVLLMRHRSVADRGMRFHRPRQPVAPDHST
jgi:cation diffusion facilitator CzcD-associated flavoprotein CzcO